MIYTTTLSDRYTDNFNQELLIEMPHSFTVLEADSFQQKLRKICQTNSASKKIVLDFKQTTFMDNNGLIGLCQIVHEARSSRFNLAFSSFSPQVQMILSLARLDDVIKVESDAEAFDKVPSSAI